MTTSTLQQRLDALPPHHQSAFLTYLEFMEWKNQLPSGQAHQAKHNAELGERLRTVREFLKQSEHAARHVAGLSLLTYRRYEQGRILRWPTNTIMAYCETWNVSFGWLIEGTGTMFQDDSPPQIEPTPEPIAKKRRYKLRAPYAVDAETADRVCAAMKAAPAHNVVRLFPGARP